MKQERPGLLGRSCKYWVKKMAAAYPDTPLILWHWGSVDAPEWKEFNGDSEVVTQLIVNPERVVVLAPGESYCLERLILKMCKVGEKTLILRIFKNICFQKCTK